MNDKEKFNFGLKSPGINHYDIPPGPNLGWYDILTELLNERNSREQSHKLKKIFQIIAYYYQRWYEREAKRVVEQELFKQLNRNEELNNNINNELIKIRREILTLKEK